MYNIASPITPIKGIGPRKEKAMEGGKWQIVDEFDGRSHQDGGIDILVQGGVVRRINAPHHKPEEYAGWGSFWKSVGAGAYGAGEGLLDTLTFGATDQLTDMGYEALQRAGGSTEQEIREQNSVRGYGTTAGAITGGILSGGATTGSAIQQGSKGLGAGISYGSPDSKAAQAIGTYLPLAGSIAGMAVGNAGYGGDISAATKGAEAATKAGDVAKAAELTDKASRLTSLSKLAETSKSVSKYSPLIQAGLSTLMRPQGRSQVGPVQQTIREATPFLGPGMMQSYRELGRQIKGEAAPSRGTGMSMMDGVENFMSESGPIQFQAQPIQQALSDRYLQRYGINSFRIPPGINV